MKPTVFALTAVFNRSCEDSSTCRALQELGQGLRLILYDNSEQNYKNRDWCAQKGWTFLGGEGNRGLAKAYNEAVAYCRSEDPEGILCFFDDDAQLDAGFFSRLTHIIRSNDGADIFVPILLSGGRIFSPSIHRKNGKCRRFPSQSALFAYNGKQLTAVNNGLAVRLRVFDDYGYDERLFVDYVDHAFFRAMNRQGRKMMFFDSGSEHLTSSHEHPPLRTAAWRYRLFMEDTRVFWGHRPLICFRVLLRRTVRLTLEYKSLIFVRICLLGEKETRRRCHNGKEKDVDF